MTFSSDTNASFLESLLESCIIDGKCISLGRNRKPIQRIDPINWLASQNLYPKIFWKEKSSSTIRVAAGAYLSCTQIPFFSEGTNPNVRFYGGMRFFPTDEKPSSWANFPSSYFWLPQIEMECTPDTCDLFFYGTNTPLNLVSSSVHTTTSYSSRVDVPPFPMWKQLVEQTLKAIRSQEINKLVLARQTTLQLDPPLSPWDLLSKLAATPNPATLFLFQLSPHKTFVGATPELLFERKGSQLTTEALAGTRPKGDNKEEESRFAQELLMSAKDRREFGFVKQALETLLLPFAKKGGGWEGQDRILKTSHLQHLYNRLHLELASPLSDSQLLAHLHPTPALGGHPKQQALSLLKKLEPFDRGWYGAPIGMISPERSVFYAAIRSALLEEKCIHLFSGLGLVEGSNPEQEWEELNAKISWFHSLLLSSSGSSQQHLAE